MINNSNHDAIMAFLESFDITKTVFYTILAKRPASGDEIEVLSEFFNCVINFKTIKHVNYYLCAVEHDVFAITTVLPKGVSVLQCTSSNISTLWNSLN